MNHEFSTSDFLTFLGVITRSFSIWQIFLLLDQIRDSTASIFSFTYACIVNGC